MNVDIMKRKHAHMLTHIHTPGSAAIICLSVSATKATPIVVGATHTHTQTLNILYMYFAVHNPTEWENENVTFVDDDVVVILSSFSSFVENDIGHGSDYVIGDVQENDSESGDVQENDSESDDA